MTNNFTLKIIYKIFFIKILIFEKYLKNEKISKKFVEFNNKIVLKKIKNKKIKKVSILLPHCLQKYDCNLKITNNIENCKQCNMCDISEILSLKKKYEGKLDVKVATGGTLARMYIKEYRPDLVVAIACKRDLVSGINDSFPMKVYGIFNEIINKPCLDTRVSIKKIEKILEEVELG